MEIFKTLVSYMCMLALFVMKWDKPHICKDYINKNKRIVFICPHTSYFDSIIIILYCLAYPDVMKNVKYLVGPNFMKIPILSYILRYTGAITSSSVNVKQGGHTKIIVDYLNKLDSFHIVISPKGTIKKREWRSGYYYIARDTKAIIMSLGFDYKKRKLVLSDIFNNKDSTLPEMYELEEKLQIFMRTINPYNQNNIEY